MSIDQEIGALRQVLEASNDLELAERLGIRNTAVSQWRSRGAIPAKYRALYSDPTLAEVLELAAHANRFRFFGDPANAAWLQVSMGILPPSLFTAVEGEQGLARSTRLERACLRAMTLALHVSKKRLGLAELADDGDVAALITAIQADYAKEVADIVEVFGPQTK